MKEWIKEHLIILGPAVLFGVLAIPPLWLLSKSEADESECAEVCAPYVGKVIDKVCHCLDDEKRWVPTEALEAAR